ncbi:Hypothetical predicted protein [Xyrichtys novacula]|nr:Hypothetical predicted protein [Xyrichtys novacula]
MEERGAGGNPFYGCNNTEILNVTWTGGAQLFGPSPGCGSLFRWVNPWTVTGWRECSSISLSEKI